jgi:hypothetical protein
VTGILCAVFGLWGKKSPKYVAEPDEFYSSRGIADAALVAAAVSNAHAARPTIVVSFFPASLERVGAAMRAHGTTTRRLTNSDWSGPTADAAVPCLLDASLLRSAHGFDAWVSRAARPLSFLFVEHFPRLSPERAVLDIISAQSEPSPQHVRFFAGMDEPLLTHFNGARVLALMKAMNVDPKEKLTHPLLGKSIANAQKKLEQRVPHPAHAESDSEWFALNLPPG